MSVPILNKKEFQVVINAFKFDPVYITSESVDMLKKEESFIPIEKYSEWMVIENEIGIAGGARFILKVNKGE